MYKPTFSRLALSMLAAAVPLALLLGQVPAEPADASKATTAKRAKRPPRPGVSDPSLKRDMSTITPTAEFPIEGVPDWQVVTEDSVWVSNGPKNTVHRLDIKTNKEVAAIPVGQKPCSGLAAGFGSIWVPNCGDKTMSRIDIATNKAIATVAAGPSNSEGGLTTGAGSVWLVSDIAGKLSRIDPATNQVIAEIPVAAGSVSAVFGEGAVWVSSPEKSVVTRVDPKTNLATAEIAVGPGPRFLTYGAGSIWTLNQGDGTVSRVDAKTGKLLANIELGVPGTGGELAYGEGRVWATVFEMPITSIDPATNKVARQWVGPGGDAIRAAHGSVWLSNLRQKNVWRIDAKALNQN